MHKTTGTSLYNVLTDYSAEPTTSTCMKQLIWLKTRPLLRLISTFGATHS